MFEWFSIVISSLILEDPTTLLVSTRVHDGHLSWWMGGSALFAGILVGDIGLYLLGYLARVGVIRQALDPHTQPVTSWYIFAVRFAPGLRVVVYTTTGFFKFPFWKFLIVNSLSCVIWSVLLIYLGQQVYKYTGWWGVGGLIGVILVWQIIKRVKKSRRQKITTDNSGTL